MKHVWILNHYALEPSSPGGTRHFSLAENLRQHGWNATIIAASVEHNSNRQRLASHERVRHERLGDVPFLWLRTPQYRGNGGARMLNMLVYAGRALLPASTRGLARPDAIIGSSVHPFAAAAGALLARRYRVPFIFEVRDLWPQTLIDLGRLAENGLPARLMRRLESWLYREADSIITLLPYAADYIASTGAAREKVVWIPNGVELSAFPSREPPRPQEGQPFVLMYLGAHGTANGLEAVLDAMQLVSKQVGSKAIRLRMIGDGPLKADLKARADRLGLANVSFEPPIAKQAIPDCAAEADAFLISVLDRPRLYRYGISMNKLFDYLAAARPIVIASAAANNPVRDANAGLSVPPGDPAALAEAILALYRMPPDERRKMGLAGRQYVEENHGFDRLAGRLASTLDACRVTGSAPARTLESR